MIDKTEQDTFDALRRLPFSQIEDILDVGSDVRNGSKKLPTWWPGNTIDWSICHISNLRNSIDRTGWTQEEIVFELKKRYGETR